MHGFGYGCGWMGGFGPIGAIISGIIGLVVVIAIIVLIVWAVRRLSAGAAFSRVASGAPNGPREILQQRYARGEITREQYQQMLDDLNR